MSSKPASKEKDKPTIKEYQYAHCSYTYAQIDEPNYGPIDHEGLPNLNLGVGPDAINSRSSGGGKVFYGEGNKVIQLANDTFGYNGWNTTIRQFTVDHCECDDRNKVDMSASAIIRVTLKDGTHREDIGCGSCSNVLGRGPAFDKVRKECVTDGIKRALRQFGWLFMSTYDGKYMAEVHKTYKTIQSRVGLGDMYHGRLGIQPRNAAKAGTGQAQEPSAQPPQQHAAEPQGQPASVAPPALQPVANPPAQPARGSPTKAPQPARRLNSSPRKIAPSYLNPEDFDDEDMQDFDDLVPNAGNGDNEHELMASDDFDRLDEVLNQRNEQQRGATPHPPEEDFNPVTGENEKQLLTFVSGSQAEHRQNLEEAPPFNPNTPDKFQFKKSAPIKRSVIIEAKTSSPLSASRPIPENASTNNTTVNNGNDQLSKPDNERAANNPPPSSAGGRVVASTPLVKKRPLQDRGQSAINTPGSQQKGSDGQDPKKMRISD